MGMWEADEDELRPRRDTPKVDGCPHCGASARDQFADLNRELPYPDISQLRKRFPTTCIKTMTWVWCPRTSPGRFSAEVP